MAKLLVMWSDNGSYGSLDVVDVREDSVPWGNREGYPTFLRVSLPGVTPEQAQFLMDVEFDPDGLIDKETGGPQQVRHKRAWKIVQSRINPPIWAQLEAAYMVSGEYVVPDANGMLAWLEKKIDGSGKGEW